MKKTLSVILAVLLCGTMLAGCARSGGESKETKEETTAETREKVVPKKKQAVATAETTVETTTETTTETTDEIKPIVPSGSDNPFLDAYYGLTGGSVEPFKGSNTYNITKELQGTKSLYFSYTTAEESCDCAIEGDNIYVRSENEGYCMYIVDNVLTMYNEDTKTGLTSYISDDDLGSFGLDGVLDVFDFDGNIETTDEMITVYKDVEVNGKKYIMEVDDSQTYLYVFDSNAKFVTYENLHDLSSEFMIFNEFTSKVPAGIWNQPTGYEIVDMDDLQY